MATARATQQRASTANIGDAMKQKKAASDIPVIKREVQDLTELLKQYEDSSSLGDKVKYKFQQQIMKAVMSSNNVQLKKDTVGAFYEGMAAEFTGLRDQLADENKVILDEFVGGLKSEFENLVVSLDQDNQKQIDKLTEQIEETKKGQTAFEVLGKDISKAIRRPIPTGGKVMNAFLQNSNPFLRLAVDAGKGFFGYLGDVKKRAATVDKKKLQTLEEERAKLTASNDEDGGGAEVKTDRAPREKPLVSRLDMLKEQGELQTKVLQELLLKLAPAAEETVKVARVSNKKLQDVTKEAQEATKRSTERLESTTGGIINQLMLLNDSVDVLVGQQASMIDLQRDALRQSEKASLQNLEALKEAEKNRGPQAGNMLGNVDTNKEEGILGHFLGSFLGTSISAFLGKSFLKAGKFLKIGEMLSPVTKFFSGAGGLMKGIGKIAKFSKFLPLIGQVVLIVDTIWDFFSGFINAGEILGKDSVNMWDRISAGVGSMIGSIVGIFDFVSGLFGFDTKYGEAVKSGVSKFLAAIPEFLTKTYDFLKNIFVDSYKSLESSIKSIIDSLATFFTEGIKNYAISAIRALPGGDKILSAVSWVGEKASNLNELVTQKDKPAATFPTSYNSNENQSKALDNQAEAMKRNKEQSVAVQTNNVNASQTTINNTPLFTRNSDDSVRQSITSRSNF